MSKVGDKPRAHPIPPGVESHPVQRGDNLSVIAKAHGLVDAGGKPDVDSLIAANVDEYPSLKHNPNLILEKWELVIPGKTTQSPVLPTTAQVPAPKAPAARALAGKKVAGFAVNAESLQPGWLRKILWGSNQDLINAWKVSQQVGAISPQSRAALRDMLKPTRPPPPWEKEKREPTKEERDSYENTIVINEDALKLIVRLANEIGYPLTEKGLKKLKSDYRGDHREIAGEDGIGPLTANQLVKLITQPDVVRTSWPLVPFVQENKAVTALSIHGPASSQGAAAYPLLVTELAAVGARWHFPKATAVVEALQRLCNSLSDDPPLSVDGDRGPATNGRIKKLLGLKTQADPLADPKNLERLLQMANEADDTTLRHCDIEAGLKREALPPEQQGAFDLLVILGRENPDRLAILKGYVVNGQPLKRTTAGALTIDAETVKALGEKSAEFGYPLDPAGIANAQNHLCLEDANGRMTSAVASNLSLYLDAMLGSRLGPLFDSSANIGKRFEQRRYKYDKLFLANGSDDVSPALLKALATTESALVATAESNAGAYGLMQFMPDTAADYGLDDRGNPAKSVRAAAAYLKNLEYNVPELQSLVKRNGLNSTLPLAVASYNAGQGMVGSQRGVPVVAPGYETRNYVPMVLLLAGYYEGLGEPRRADA